MNAYLMLPIIVLLCNYVLVGVSFKIYMILEKTSFDLVNNYALEIYFFKSIPKPE